MKMGKKTGIVLGALLLLLAVGVTAYAAANYGSQSDPLITQSYLTDVLRPELERAMEVELQDVLSSVQSASGEFTPLTLQYGQQLSCGVGTEILLRSGGAWASAFSGNYPALADSSVGEAVQAGVELDANHLYIVTIQGNGITAASADTLLLIRGGYAIR